MDLRGLVPTAAVEAPEGSLSVEAVGEVVMYGLLLDRLGNTPRKWTFHEDKKKKKRHCRTNLDLAAVPEDI